MAETLSEMADGCRHTSEQREAEKLEMSDLKRAEPTILWLLREETT